MKTLSISDAREQFSSVINWAEENQDDVIVQNRGKAKAVIIPFADYELLRKAREEARKKEAIEKLKQVALEVRANFPNISSEEAEQIGRDITEEAIKSLEASDAITFE